MSTKSSNMSDKKQKLFKKFQEGGKLLFEINDINQLADFDKSFSEINKGTREKKLRNKQAAKEQLEQIVKTGGSVKVYSDRTFDIKDAQGNDIDFGKTVDATIGQKVGFPLNIKNRTRESDIIGDLFKTYSSNNTSFTKSTRDISKDTSTLSEDEVKKQNAEITKSSGFPLNKEMPMLGKNLASLRADYEKETGVTWDSLKDKGFLDRRKYSKGFVDFLEGKEIEEKGFNYEAVKKDFFPDNYLDPTYRTNIRESYSRLGLDFSKPRTINRGRSTVTSGNTTVSEKTNNKKEPIIGIDKNTGKEMSLTSWIEANKTRREAKSKTNESSEKVESDPSKILGVEKSLAKGGIEERYNIPLSSQNPFYTQIAELRKRTAPNYKSANDISTKPVKIDSKELAELNKKAVSWERDRSNYIKKALQAEKILKERESEKKRKERETRDKEREARNKERVAKRKAEKDAAAKAKSSAIKKKQQQLDAFTKGILKNRRGGVIKAQSGNKIVNASDVNKKRGSFKRRGSEMSGDSLSKAFNSSLSANKTDLLRALGTSAANYFLLNKKVDQTNPFNFDPSLPILPVQGIPQATRASFIRNLQRSKRGLTRPVSSDPTLNTINRQVAAQQEQQTLGDFAVREADLLTRESGRVASETARNKQLVDQNRIRSIDFMNRLKAQEAQTEIQRRQGAIAPIATYLGAQAQAKRDANAQALPYLLYSKEQEASNRLENINRDVQREIRAAAKAKGVTVEEFEKTPEYETLLDSLDPKFTEASESAKNSRNQLIMNLLYGR